MTLDTTSLITLTDSALEGGSALSAIAGQLASMPTTGTGRGISCAMSSTIVVVGSSPQEQKTMEQRSAALCATGDLFCRSNLVTLPARENAQKLVSLLRLLDPLPSSGATQHASVQALTQPYHRPLFALLGGHLSRDMHMWDYQ